MLFSKTIIREQTLIPKQLKLSWLEISPEDKDAIEEFYHGAFMGFWPTISGKSLTHTGRIKGLSNMVLSGQWLQPPGGLPVALVTGKDTIMRICQKEKKPFLSA